MYINIFILKYLNVITVPLIQITSNSQVYQQILQILFIYIIRLPTILNYFQVYLKIHEQILSKVIQIENFTSINGPLLPKKDFEGYPHQQTTRLAVRRCGTWELTYRPFEAIGSLCLRTEWIFHESPVDNRQKKNKFEAKLGVHGVVNSQDITRRAWRRWAHWYQHHDRCW